MHESERLRQRLEVAYNDGFVSRNLPGEGKYIRVVYFYQPEVCMDITIGRHRVPRRVEAPGMLYLVPVNKRIIASKREYGFVADIKTPNDYSFRLIGKDLLSIDEKFALEKGNTKAYDMNEEDMIL